MARALAYDVLARVETHDAFSNRALDAELALRELDDRDRRLGTELIYGVLTWRRALDALLDEVVHGGIDALDTEVLRTLRIGAYQLLFLDRVPSHAVVDEAVEMTRERANSGATSLVNAVLREIDRMEEDEWWDESDREHNRVQYLGERYSFPNWIANRLLQLFEFERAEQWAEAFNDRPPLYLRVLGESAEGAFEDDLDVVEGLDKALRTDRMTAEIQEELANRRWIVQDLGSQLVGLMVGCEEGLEVLDACAGLGGKTLTMGEAVGPDGGVTAVDSVKWKIDKMRRLADDSQLGDRIRGIASELQELSDEELGDFDRVLVDAPCSALGVLRRHPEIKWNRDESEIPSLVELQEELLDAAARRVRPGGVLTYSVCSFTTEEGPKQVDAFLKRHPEFESVGPPEDAAVDWDRYVDEDGALSLNPVDHDADAFYAARLRRVPEA